MTPDFKRYLTETPVINFNHPAIERIAKQLCASNTDQVSRIKASFEFVRDSIAHSFDIEAHQVTCSASEVLLERHGICYAKSHLLTAILRAMHIPSGICYQKLIIDDNVPGVMCLHAFNAAYIASLGRWIKFDARGNKEGVNAEFNLEKEQLAYAPREVLGEKDYPDIYAQPLPSVIAALTDSNNCKELKCNLPADV
jgi:transglutaminase-like putative cysteine protease